MSPDYVCPECGEVGYWQVVGGDRPKEYENKDWGGDVLFCHWCQSEDLRLRSVWGIK